MDAPPVMATNTSGKQLHQRMRISKACQECRRRRIKCDGTPMCRNCEATSTVCSYRSKPRIRKSTKRIPIAKKPQQPSSLLQSRRSSTTPLATPSHQQQLPLGKLQVSPERPPIGRKPSSILQFGVPQTQVDQPEIANVNRSISATHAASASCTLQLYYGASSNFSFLQQIHHSLYEATNPLRPRSEVEEVGARLDLYGQRSHFFGTRDPNYQPSGFIGTSQMALLPDQLANTFLEDYLKTIYYLYPFQPPDEIHRLFDLLHKKPQVGKLTTDEAAIMMVVLAIGATITENTEWAEMLAENAKTIANTLGHVVNLQAVQLSLLLAHYESILSRPNSSYLYLGTAVRKAFAAGLHRETPNYEADGRKHVKQQERCTTIWCLYFHEILMCFALGRPSSLAGVDISNPYPKNQPIIVALVKLTNIMSEATGSIYAYRQSSLQDLYRKAQRIHRELQDYALDVKEMLGISLSESSVPIEIDIKHVFLHNVYYHTLALTFRPFMIADVDHQKSTFSAGNSSTLRNRSGQSINASFPWLSEACRHAVDAAFNQIRFVSLAVEHNALARGLKLVAFYVEGACYSLIYDVLRNNAAKHRNVSAVKIGLRCLTNMVPGGEMIKCNIFSIQRLLDALDVMPSRTGQQVNNSASAGLDQTSSLPGNFGFVSAPQDNQLDESMSTSYPRDTLVNFAAGWATFEDDYYMTQNAVPEPERLNHDIFNINWEFDNVSNAPRVPF